MEGGDAPPFFAETDFMIDYERMIQRRFEANLRKAMLQTGIQAVGGSAMAFYTWMETDSACWPLAFSLFGTISTFAFCSNFRTYFSIISQAQQKRLILTWNLTSNTVLYFAGVWALSQGLKDNNSLLWIPSLATSVAAYYYAVTSANDFGKTDSNKNLILKYSQMMFGPALISGAALYLLGIQGYKHEWLYCLPLIACCAVGHHIAMKKATTSDGYNNEPRYQLLKGMELMFAGSLVVVSATVLSLHAAMNDFNPFFTIFFTTTISWGVMDIIASLEAFQKCTNMELPVFYCISGMIGGPIIFLSTCVVVKIISNIYTLPMFSILAGTGVALTVKSTIDLYDLVPRPAFHRYYQRTFGLSCMVYGILASAFIRYHMGWRRSWVPALLLPAGMYLTYRGFS